MDTDKLWLYAYSWVGAITLYFKLKSDGRKVMQFLPHINPAWSSSPMVRLIDAVIFSVLGALFGFVLVQPTTPAQALAVGLGWTGLISSFTKVR